MPDDTLPDDVLVGLALGEKPDGAPATEVEKTEAFEVLVARHYGSVASVAYAALGGSSELEDVLQSAFLAAFRSLKSLEDRSKFKFWLRAIAANQARDHVRRQSVFGIPDSLGDLITMPEQETADIVESAALFDELCERLPERYSQVLYLRYYLGYTVSETSEALGIDPGLVKWRTSRARALATRLLRGETLAPERRKRAHGRDKSAFTVHTKEEVNENGQIGTSTGDSPGTPVHRNAGQLY